VAPGGHDAACDSIQRMALRRYSGTEPLGAAGIAGVHITRKL
jgi:hypothetical protein